MVHHRLLAHNVPIMVSQKPVYPDANESYNILRARREKRTKGPNWKSLGSPWAFRLTALRPPHKTPRTPTSLLKISIDEKGIRIRHKACCPSQPSRVCMAMAACT